MLRKTLLRLNSRGLSVVADPLPSAVEAPHLIEAFEKPKPFINTKRLQTFTIAVLIGAASIGSVYYILSRELASQCEEEMRLINTMSARYRAQENLAQTDTTHNRDIIPTFVVPRTYNELAEKMKANNDSDVAKKNLAATTPLLHQELIHKAKLRWNEALFNVQVQLEAYGVERRNRCESQALPNIEAALRANGLAYQELRKIS